MVKKKKLIKKNQKFMGFTLLELVVVMCVIGILITMSYPLFRTSMINNRLYSESSQLTNILALARGEALRRNDYVSVCPTSDGATCFVGNDFHTGTIVFLNSTQTGLSNAAQIIKIFDPWTQPDKGRLTTGSLVTFSADGRTNQTNTILVCKPTYPSFTIDLQASGKIQLIANAGDGGC